MVGWVRPQQKVQKNDLKVDWNSGTSTASSPAGPRTRGCFLGEKGAKNQQKGGGRTEPTALKTTKIDLKVDCFPDSTIPNSPDCPGTRGCSLGEEGQKNQQNGRGRVEPTIGKKVGTTIFNLIGRK